MEDEKIIALFWSRSEQAIEETAAKYGRLCRKIAGNILENEQDTEECLNDTYLGVWNSIPPARPAVLRAYVCRIARNLAVKKFRSNTAAKRDSRSDCLLEELEECIPAPAWREVEAQIERKELSGYLEEFLDTLGKRERLSLIHILTSFIGGGPFVGKWEPDKMLAEMPASCPVFLSA